MHADVWKTIELIDQRIESLRKLRDQLVAEFGGAQRATRPRGTQFMSLKPSDAVRAESLTEIPVTVERSNGNGGTRKDQLKEFILTHGPATRAEIIAGTQIPVGSIASCLNDKERFFNRDGKWHVRVE